MVKKEITSIDSFSIPRLEDCRENFIKNGRAFVVICPKCKLENWTPAVASGQCAWCGWYHSTTITHVMVNGQRVELVCGVDSTTLIL